MKIRSVETIPLRIPFNEAFTIAAPYEQKREHIDILIVRILTDEGGLYGIGETQAWRRQGSSEVLPNLVRVVRDIFEPILLGRSPLDISSIMHDLNATVYNSLYAQAAIGDALYDIMGKAFNLPVCKLLGGKCRDFIRVGLALSIASPAEILDKAKWAFEQGYRHLRVKIGMDPTADLENVRLLREHFGDKIVLRVDANGGMHFEQALQLLKKLEAYDLDIAEQPVPLWDLDGLTELNRRINIPISADESLSTEHSLLEIIKKRAASIVQTKVGKNGGIHYSRRLWTIAEAAGIGVFPGNHPATSVAVASVAHLCASWPVLRIVGDFQSGASDLITSDIVKSPLKVDKGYIRVPEGPGLGVELDEDKLAQFRADL